MAFLSVVLPLAETPRGLQVVTLPSPASPRVAMHSLATVGMPMEVTLGTLVAISSTALMPVSIP